MNHTQGILDFICSRLNVDIALLEQMVDAPRGSTRTWIMANDFGEYYGPRIISLMAFMATCIDMGINYEGDQLADLLFDISVDMTVDNNIRANLYFGVSDSKKVPLKRRDVEIGANKIRLLNYIVDCGSACDMQKVRRLIEYHKFKSFYEDRLRSGDFTLIN